MYYVIYVGSGRESKAEEYIEKTVPEELYDRVFHLLRHMRRKIRGQWIDSYDKLVPGYVFIRTDDVGAFYQATRRTPALLKVLGMESSGDDLQIYGLSPAEESWLLRITSCAGGASAGVNPTAELSEVTFNENDQVEIVSGPLTNMTGMIRRINLHKRIAEVEVEFMGRQTILHLGIEIIGKTEKKAADDN